MDAMNTNPLLDCKTMLAILNADPDGVAIIGAWNSMETLAREDPEGFVRLSPGLPMDNTALAGLLRCRETIVTKDPFPVSEAAPAYRNGWPDPDRGL